MKSGYIIQKSEDKGKTWKNTYWTNWNGSTFIEGDPRPVSRDSGRKFLKEAKNNYPKSEYPDLKYRLIKIEA